MDERSLERKLRRETLEQPLGGRDILIYFMDSVFGAPLTLSRGFPGGSDRKASAYNVGDPGSIPGSGRSPGEENGNPLQYTCLANPGSSVHGVAN